ncbi:hypothetical protein O181_024990 [Austropuccinia psidii MF-1]|uniref:JmjC domain-containing protein n=1 Tax=Austropuccinia psidii MF-1 TaxID=1389203 RepID=A0A9Q3H0N5_9BASI|nr:hypothetical protein [Austropuccinia psidii MF-1]
MLMKSLPRRSRPPSAAIKVCRARLVRVRLTASFPSQSRYLSSLEHSCLDLEGCGSPVGFCLQSVSKNLLDLYQDKASSGLNPSTVMQDTLGTAEALLILADEKLLSYSYKEVPDCWRQLYTDSTLIKVSSIFANQVAQKELLSEQHCRDMIRLLDMTLIVAGAPGKGRKDVVYFLINKLQSYLSNNYLALQDHNRPQKRFRKSDPPPSAHVSSPLVGNSMRCLDVCPNLQEFANTFHKSPFVIKGYCKNWRALTTAPWESNEYLKAVAGPARVVPIEVGKNYAQDDWSQRIIEWDEFLTRLDDGDPTQLHYLAQHNIFNQFPSLKDDIELPYYLDCQLPPASRPIPDTEDGAILNVWVGPAGTVSPAHIDPYYNCYAQVVGRKYVWVAPPKFGSEMYPFGTTPEDVELGPQSLQASYMTNTSQVDVLSSTENTNIPQLRECFPNFVEKVIPEALQIVLEAGDMMIMPPGWWHSMKSLEKSISVSMWF